MERFTVGRCRSGKIITSHTDLDGLDTYDEVFDAFVALSVLAIRARRRDKGGEFAILLDKEVSRLERILDRAGKLQDLMIAVNARTMLDLRDHAMRLLNPEFRE